VIVCLDAQLPPSLDGWLNDELGIDAHSLKSLGLRDAADTVIFAAAKAANAVIISKDSDFVDLVDQHGPPPQIVWLTCGNVTNGWLRALFARTWPQVAAHLAAGEPVVELS
jgi:predicted nuclease of predicted toxin-antitoxin system